MRWLKERLPSHVELSCLESEKPVVPAIAEAADVLLLDTVVKRTEVLSLAPHLVSLKWIHTLLAGVEDALIPSFMPTTPLTNSRGVYKKSLAEFAVFSMLYFAKNVPRLQQQQRDKQWQKFDCEELSGKTLAVLSYGGKYVVARGGHKSLK
jgi:phosphoglycerate dehydrogenase-like enzyme